MEPCLLSAAFTGDDEAAIKSQIQEAFLVASGLTADLVQLIGTADGRLPSAAYLTPAVRLRFGCGFPMMATVLA